MIHSRVCNFRLEGLRFRNDTLCTSRVNDSEDLGEEFPFRKGISESDHPGSLASPEFSG